MGDKEFKEIFSRRLRYYLEKRGLTQLDLAIKLDVSRQSVSSWVNGIKIPRMDKVDQMCKILHCTRDNLITEGDDEEGYYTNPETAKIAQEIFDDENLRTLFHVARNASPEQLKLAKEMLEMMKKNEENR